jgi:hypothetical protein
MNRCNRAYIGIVLLLITGIANIPFAWLHHCEYGHKHAEADTQYEAAMLVGEEVPDCPFCELHFPLYLTANHLYNPSKTDFSICLSEAIESVFLADPQLVESLRAPPVF